MNPQLELYLQNFDDLIDESNIDFPHNDDTQEISKVQFNNGVNDNNKNENDNNSSHHQIPLDNTMLLEKEKSWTAKMQNKFALLINATILQSTTTIILYLIMAESYRFFTVYLEEKYFQHGRISLVFLSFVSILILNQFLSWNDYCYNFYKTESNSFKKLHHQQHSCRLVLSRLLGSIGAPFLSLQQQQQQNGHSNVDHIEMNTTNLTTDNTTPDISSGWFSLLVDLCHANVELIQTVDIAINIIKLGTALQLGATEGTVERVERSLLGRKQADINTAVVSVSFGSLRKLVAQAIVCQLESLLLLSNNDNIDNNNNNNNNDNNVVSHGSGEVIPTTVVTLTWLRSSRQELAELLSCLLDRFSSTTQLLGLVGTSLKKKMEESMVVAREMRQHLQSSIDSTSTTSQDGNTCSSSSSQRSSNLNQQFIETQKNLRNLYVAFWALKEETLQHVDSSISSCSDVDATYNVADLRDSLVRVNQWNSAFNTSIQTLDRDFFQEQVEDRLPKERKAVGEVGNSCRSKNEQSEELSYSIETDSHNKQQFKPTATFSPKTAVFAGNGALEPPKSRTRTLQGRASPGINVKYTSMNTVKQPDPVSHHMLLGELRRRLKTLSLPEEETAAEDTSDDGYEQSTQMHEKTTGLSLSFGGAAGSMLVGELNETLKLLGHRNSTNDDEEESADG